MVHRALLLRQGPKIGADELFFEQAALSEPESLPHLELPAGVTLEQMMQRLERQLIENTLRRFNNNKGRTAQALGLARSSLYTRLKAWGLVSEDEEAVGPGASPRRALDAKRP